MKNDEKATASAVDNNVWDGLPMPKRIWAILAVAFGVSVSVLDGTITNVALPTISTELNISSADSILIVNAYQLAIVISILSLSSLGDMIGYRKIYVTGLIVFMIGSFGCALSHTLLSLVSFRVIQGFGAAAITSVNTTLIRLIYPRRYLGRGLGINAMIVGVSAVAGPTVAAGILSMASWPWLFAVNIPVGIIALTLSSRFLPDNPVKSERHRFDWKGGILNALTFGLLIVSVEAYSHEMNIRWVLTCVVLFLAVGFFFVREQRHKPSPILPLDLLRIPIFTISVCTSICSFVAQMLALVSLPFLLQHTFGFDEVATGLILTAWPAAVMITAPLAGMLVERVHAGILGGTGLSIMAVGLAALAFLPAQPTHAGIVWRLVLCGIGFGLFQSPNNSILIASAPQRRSGAASGMLATARLLGQTTGAALVALMFHLVPDNSSKVALLTACGFALAAAVISCLRISLALPPGLVRKRN